MAITTLDGLIAAFGVEGWSVLKAGFTPQAVGSFTSLWTTAGVPGAGGNSASGVAGDVPTSATAGAFPFTNPTAPALSYLARLAANATTAGQLLVYDRLWQQSGLSATLTSAQTVNSVALTRPDALGADAEAWWQIYTVMGAGATGPTIVYTDQDGTATQTATLPGFAATAAAGRTIPFALAAGDTGVRSIQSYTNGATLTSGTFGLIIRRFVAATWVSIVGCGVTLDAIQLGLPRVYDSACLELLWMANAASATTVSGNIALAQG